MEMKSPLQPCYRFGDFRLDPNRMTLERGAERIPATPRVVSTLLYLVEHAGRTVTRDEMLRALWPGRIAEDANLNQAISAVRKILANGSAGEEWVITVPGKGYRFSAVVTTEGGFVEQDAPLFHPASGGNPGLPQAPGHDSRSGPRRRWLRAALAIVVVLGLAAGAALLWPFAHPARRLPKDRTEVVVADLQNETGDHVFDHIVPRLLQVRLAQSPFLRVSSDAKIAKTLALMERRPDSPLTAQVAREACARNNGGAVIAPTIAQLGASYILTVTVTDCLSGQTLVEDKSSAPSKEAIGRALETLSEGVRRRLGESEGSVSRFDIPLAAARTASFDALTAYSEGLWLHSRDRETEAIAAYRHAIALDPQFAMAYDGLYSPLYVTKQFEAANQAAARAYALRGTVSDRDGLLIASHYHFLVEHDLNAAIQDLRLLTSLYPLDSRAWSNLSNVENWLGDYPAAVAAGERALQLEPNSVISYSVLARALNHGGQIDRALKVGGATIAKGLAGGDTRGQMIEQSFELGDRQRADQLIADARGTPLERDSLLAACDVYTESGQMRRAEAAVSRAEELGRPAGISIDYADFAADYLHLGLIDGAKAKLALVPLHDRDGFYWSIAAWVEAPATVEAGLAQALAHHPHDTLLNEFFAPQVRAVLLSRRGRIHEALDVLKLSKPVIYHDISGFYLRGLLQLEAKDGAGAAQSFRSVLEQPGFSYTNPYGLARLGLARALRLSGDIDGSRRAYQAFLADWRQADPDLPPLRAARAEYAVLPAVNAKSRKN